jgi:hypothetical protein
MNPPGGMFTWRLRPVVHKNAKSYDKALALIDSSLSDEAAHYTIGRTGDGPANIEELRRRWIANSARGLPRDTKPSEERYVPATAEKQGSDRQRLTEIRAGL